MTQPAGDGASSPDGSTLGAYGLILDGLPGAAPFMQPLPVGAPRFELRVDVDPSAPALTRDDVWLDEASAQIPLIGGGRLAMAMGEPLARFTLPFRPSDDELLHPYLAPAAALFWQWEGREALHAGVFGTGSGADQAAILVVGDKEAGKSTTLAWLAAAGVPVLSDDLAVTDGATVSAGPRSIDLRPDPASPLRFTATRTVRGDRTRVELPPAPETLPVRGVVHLQWGGALALTPIGAQERLTLLSRQRTFYALAAEPLAMLELGTLPAIRASRPRDLAGLDAFGQALLGYFA